jgi:hypothetical protein
MAKVKYYYDSENLAYRKIKPQKRRKFGFFMLFLLGSALFGFLCLVLLMNTSFFSTPKDRILGREIENLKLNYAILNKKVETISDALADVEDRDNNLYRTYFNTAKISDAIRKSGFEGKNRYTDLVGFNNSDLVLNTTKKVDVLFKEVAIQSKSLDEILKMAQGKK